MGSDGDTEAKQSHSGQIEGGPETEGGGGGIGGRVATKGGPAER